LLEWVFDGLLRFLFPDADKIFDFEREVGFLDKELGDLLPSTENEAEIRFVDKLIKIFLKGGGEEWVLIHIEVQGRTEREDRLLFPERMFQYFYRCLDRHKKPIAAIAIFTGPDAGHISTCYKYEFMNTNLQYQFNVLRVSDYTNTELAESQNPFAWVLMIAKNALLKGKDIDKKLLDGKLFIFRRLFDNGVFERDKLKAILRFLDNYIQFDNPEMNRTFKEEIDKITGKKNTMDIFEQLAQWQREDGIEIGFEKGRQQEKENTVRIFLSHTEFDTEKIASLVGVPISLVEKIKEELRAK